MRIDFNAWCIFAEFEKAYQFNQFIFVADDFNFLEGQVDL
jgi:hypothetical protein